MFSIPINAVLVLSRTHCCSIAQPPCGVRLELTNTMSFLIEKAAAFPGCFMAYYSNISNTISTLYVNWGSPTLILSRILFPGHY